MFDVEKILDEEKEKKFKFKLLDLKIKYNKVLMEMEDI